MTARSALVLALGLALPCLPTVAHAADPVPAPVVTPATAPAPSGSTLADADADEELRRVKRVRMGGLVTMGVGMGFIIIGGGIAGGYTTGAVGAKAMWSGVALAAVGVVPTIVGGVMYGVANRKMTRLQAQRVASLRMAPMAGRAGGGLMFGGRF